MFRIKQKAIVALLAGMFSLTSCAGHEELKAGLRKSIDASAMPVVEKITVVATPAPPDQSPTTLDYQVGIGDILNIFVYSHPELSIVSKTDGTKGSRVDGAGNINLPLIGTVKVAGMTVSMIRETVEAALRKFMQDPSAVVEVAEYHSKPLYLMGQFRTPGVYYMDRPLNLLQGIAFGNGFDASANLRGVRLLRDNKIVPVDVYSLILDGRIEQNVWLRAGDTLFIPDNRRQNIFVFGNVTKPGPQPMLQGRMNLLEAISTADPRSTGSDLKNVRIIRSLTTTTGELLVVDLASIRRGEAMPLELLEGDVIYVPRNSFGTWNDAINDILPSLTAVSALLQPFVSIEYLMRYR